mmetsp:Transcript_76927/g.220284  ORF Transcript_76927/g.220284 Transcript_76927/m.220284 type:complete len:215 (+) Transcript_76927:126-770(+)
MCLVWKRYRSYPVLVGAGPRQVTDPLHGLVVALLLHFQEADSQPGSCELGHIEAHCDGRLYPLLVRHSGSQLHLCEDRVLVPAGEASDAPDDGTLGGLKSRPAVVDFVDDAPGRVLWARDVDLHIRRSDVLVVHRRDLETQLQLVAPQHLDIGQQLEWALDVLGNSVRHQLEDAVRRYERNLSVDVELRKANALVKPVVVQSDAFVRRTRLVSA